MSFFLRKVRVATSNSEYPDLARCLYHLAFVGRAIEAGHVRFYLGNCNVDCLFEDLHSIDFEIPCARTVQSK